MVHLRTTAALAFEKEAGFLGRNAGPALLSDWWHGGKLTRDDLHAVIGDVWSGGGVACCCIGPKGVGLAFPHGRIRQRRRPASADRADAGLPGLDLGTPPRHVMDGGPRASRVVC